MPDSTVAVEFGLVTYKWHKEKSYLIWMASRSPEKCQMTMIDQKNNRNTCQRGQDDTSPNTVTFYSFKDEDDDDEDNEANKVIEESPNGRWSKLDTEISVQKLTDFDSANLAIDPVIHLIINLKFLEFY